MRSKTFAHARSHNHIHANTHTCIIQEPRAVSSQDGLFRKRPKGKGAHQGERRGSAILELLSFAPYWCMRALPVFTFKLTSTNTNC